MGLASDLVLGCFPTTPSPPKIIPGQPDRAWMDAFSGRHPYRCLPLTIANGSGWEILCPFGFEARWNGDPGADAITIIGDPDATFVEHFVKSHFCRGVLTFHTGWLFRTSPEWALRAAGVPNSFKHGLAAMEGVVETDWLPYPFTMNWQFTAPGSVRFEKDEPFCFITPVAHRQLEAFRPVERKLETDPVLAEQYANWTTARTNFNDSIAAGDPSAVKQAWQRYYFRGEYPDRRDIPDAHINKRRLKTLET